MFTEEFLSKTKSVTWDYILDNSHLLLIGVGDVGALALNGYYAVYMDNRDIEHSGIQYYKVRRYI